jgi:hypothetical protein
MTYARQIMQSRLSTRFRERLSFVNPITPCDASSPLHPIHALPEVRPAMNIARTLAIAYAVWPKISPSALLQST